MPSNMEIIEPSTKPLILGSWNPVSCGSIFWPAEVLHCTHVETSKCLQLVLASGLPVVTVIYHTVHGMIVYIATCCTHTYAWL